MKNPNPRVGESLLETRATLTDQRERIVFAVLRNIIPIIGILFLGWLAQNLIVLYFVDTLGAMWALITALALNFPEAQTATTFFGRARNFATMVFVSGFLVAFMAIPLGMPLYIYLAMVDWNWLTALRDSSFAYGLIFIAVLSFVGMLRQYQYIARVTPDRANVKRDFGILMARWVIVLLLIYFVGFLLGEWGAYILVIGYAAATFMSEVFPDRLVGLFDKSRATRGR